MPWKSGWRARRDLYREATVKDVRIEMHPLPGGGMERRGIVLLDISASVVTPDGGPIPDLFLPTVVLVKDPDGWRRRYFF
jgi:hypothetical protein